MCREVKRPQRPMERAGEGCLIPVSEVFEFLIGSSHYEVADVMSLEDHANFVGWRRADAAGQ